MEQKLTFKCTNCGSCFTYFGEKAYHLEKARKHLMKLYLLETDKPAFISILYLMEMRSTCCNNPDIRYKQTKE